MSNDSKQIIQQIKKKEFKPLYLLHGEESFYIDNIEKAIIANALEEHERDFNMSIIYGLDAEVGALIAEAKSYPMMAERRLVILREAQAMKELQELADYAASPTATTIFVIVHKHGALRANAALYKHIKKNGLVFKSEKIKEYQLIGHIEGIAKDLGYPISTKASNLLAEFLGDDLSRMHSEIEKLALLVEKGSTINEVHVEENIGISKDYNMFELTNAVAIRDVPKAFAIVDYFEKNPKSGELIPVISSLFRLFSNLMRMHFLKVPDPEAAKILRLHPYAHKKLKNSLKIYPPKKISSNISHLHEYDLKSKGVGNATFTNGELMRELVFKLMH